MRPFPSPVLLFVSLAVIMAGCSPSPTLSPPVPDTLTPAPPTLTLTLTETPTPTPEPLAVRFAVIGDYGWGGAAEAEVAALVHSWEPDIIITVGDNNYPVGAAAVIDEHIGQFYQDYIFPYTGSYGPGAAENRFFPTLGNHDWYTEGAQPYLDYFTLPGNERYYDFTWGPVHFFALNSGDIEPDGVSSGSIQAAWLEERMTVSASTWQVVYFHYAPYSSAYHGSIDWMRWPFAAWGADAVLSGHDHAYERLLVEGIPYFVNGSGGAGIYNFNDPLPETQFRNNADNGAMLVTASEAEILFEFYSRAGDLVDSYRVTKP
ncbi:MAG: metallophosphoesterase [Chloroflexi bacterium]|nr:metallophosphoesterase [Chloroflexota bacterium]